MTGVNWVKLGKDGFDDAVEAVIHRQWKDIATVYAPDGRGGDGGVDIMVEQGSRRRVYQIKFFADGFTGNLKSTRQRQIRRSFERACGLSSPPAEWLLVVPTKLTDGERDFVNSLAFDGGPRVTILDAPALNELIAPMTDIHRYLVRDELAQLVQDYNLEKAAIAGGEPDLSERIRRLGDLADTQSLHWATDYSRSGDQVTYALRPKHPNAAIADPITLKFSVSFGPGDAEAQAAFERSLNYGARGTVRLPPSVVTHASVQGGPAIFHTEMTNAEVVLEPIPANTHRHAEFRFLKPDGTLHSSNDATLIHAEKGRTGFSAVFKILDRIEIEIDMTDPIDGETTTVDSTGPMRLSYDLRNIYPDDAVRVLEFLVLLGAEEIQCEVRIEDEQAFRFTSVTEANEDLPILIATAHDLAAVQKHLNTRFKQPAVLTPKMRIDLRVVRALLDGYTTQSPAVAVLTFELSREAQEIPSAGNDDVFNDGGPIDHPLPDFTVTVGDRQLHIPGVRAFARHAAIANGDEARAAIAAGKADGFVVKVRSTDSRYFRLYIADRIPANREDTMEAWWNLPGIDQPDDPRDEELTE